MKKELIADLFGKFESACYIYEGIECWSAREIQPILGYARWENFTNALDKAKKACKMPVKKYLTIFVDSRKWLNWAVLQRGK